METTPGLDFWWRFVAMLALETSVVALIAFALQSVTVSALWRRTIWQASALGLLTLLAVELSGGSRIVAGWMKPAQLPARTISPVSEQRAFSVASGELPEGSTLSVGARIVAPDSMPHSWWPGMLWLAGSALLAGRMIFIRTFFLLHARRRRTASDPELLARVQKLSASLGIQRKVRVLEMNGLRGPIAFGVMKPTIGLPREFPGFDPREQDAMLIHELAHLAARDPVWYSLVDLLAALMWWHPLIWWIRRQLHAATEAAADEACVLVEDGPNILAEALVRLGSRLLERQRLGLLGIEGNGFRSDLGRRVERLMRLNGREWRPLRRVRLWTAKTAGPAALVAITLCCSAWMMPAKERSLPNEWAHSLVGRALAAVRDASKAPHDEIARGEKPGFVGGQSVVAIPQRQRSQTESLERPPRSIYAQVERIRLPIFASEGAPLGEVVNRLSQEVRSHDTEGRGIRFVVQSNAADAVIKISPAVTDVSVFAALNAIVGGADRPLKYSVEPSAIVLALHTPESEKLYTRTFKLDPNRIAHALEVAMLGATNKAQQISELMREHLRSLGIDVAPPKAVFWNDRLGMLMVRATLEDLDAIEKSVQVLNTPLPQVTIDVKIAELPEGARKQLGIDWLAGAVTSVITTNQPRDPFADTNTATANYAGILTGPQYRLVVRAMEQNAGVDVLSAPRVTAVSARQTQIKVVSIKTVVGIAENAANESGLFDLVTDQHEYGPIVDVVPIVSEDGYTIELNVIATIREFLDYEPTAERVNVRMKEGGVESMPRPLPRFRVNQAKAQALVWDGQTLAVSMGTPGGKDRMAFVTVTIIDPGGESNASRG